MKKSISFHLLPVLVMLLCLSSCSETTKKTEYTHSIPSNVTEMASLDVKSIVSTVDEMGLDPNMDSWPLDQNAIVQILNSQSWSDLEWSEGDDEAAVESAQNVRGFHTLEFLLYKNGEPRKVQ